MLPVALGLGLAVGAPVDRGPPDRVPRPVLGPGARLEVGRSIRDLGYDRRALRSTADGGYDYDDPRGRFRARIEPDGSIHVGPGSPVDDAAAVTCILGYCLDGTRAGGPDAHFDPSPGDRAMALALDGSPAAPVLLGVGGRFGLPLMSSRAAEAFREATFEMRLEMARSAMRGRIVAALARLEDELASLEQDTTLTGPRLRALLFERWDACEELVPGSAATDLAGDLVGDLVGDLEALRRQAGERARRRIERFVRTHLPRGSGRGFTPAELRRLNERRRSRAKFEPYRRPEVAPAPSGLPEPASSRPSGPGGPGPSGRP